MQICVAVVILLAFALAANGAGGVGDKTITLGSRALRLVFDTSGERLALKSLAGPGPEWIGEPKKDSSLWKIALQGPGGAVKDVGSADARLVNADGGGNKARFEWSVALAGGATANVVMAVRVENKGPMSYWSLAVSLPDGCKVVRADFPVIPNVKLDAGPKLAAPVGWGLEYDLKPGMKYEATYPSLVAAMQFVAFYGSGNGLYVGLHDPKANHKFLSVKADEGGVHFFCTNWPEIPEKGGGVYKVPFEAAIGVFHGGYYEVAQIYRDFTYKTAWGKGGPVSKRPIPQWLKDIDLWLMPSAEPLKNVDECRKARDYFGVPIGLHWYNWHQIPFDTLYPDYFPAKEHFAEGVKALRDAGMHVMPYINGRLADPKSKFWTGGGTEPAATPGDAGRSAAKQENGEFYTEVYGSKAPLNVMCPYTRQWQDEVRSLVDRLVNECGVNGVYIDQISAAAAVRCFDPAHGHPVGGGHFWVDGYRKMLDSIRKKLPKDAMLTTEENTECWIDQLDALLMVNTPGAWGGRPIPLFPAVYSGRTITFGFQYISGDDISKSLPWRVKMAQAFVWGSQLGWVGIGGIMASEAANEAEFLKNLAQCRKTAHKFVVTGRFLGMIEVRGDNPHLTGEATGSFGGTYKIDTPAVLGSAWQAEDGTTGVLLANMSDEAREVELNAPNAVTQKTNVPGRGAIVVVPRA